MDAALNRSDNGVLLQLCRWAILLTFVLNLGMLFFSQFDPFDYMHYQWICTTVWALLYIPSFIGLAILNKDKLIRICFAAIAAGAILGLCADYSLFLQIGLAGFDPFVNLLQTLLLLAAVITICLHSDIRVKYPRLSTAFIFFIGVRCIIFFYYKYIIAHRLFIFIEPKDFFPYLNFLYNVAYSIIAFAFWFVALKKPFPVAETFDSKALSSPAILCPCAVALIASIVLTILS